MNPRFNTHDMKNEATRYADVLDPGGVVLIMDPHKIAKVL